MEGSFQNRLLEGGNQPTPVVGMGVTRTGYSDRHPFTVVEVKSARCIVVQQDKAVRVDKNGMSECQAYEYERDPDGSTYVLTLRKTGRWVTKGESGRGQGWLLGERMRYHDFSF